MHETCFKWPSLCLKRSNISPLITNSHVVPNSKLVCPCTKESVSAGQRARGQSFGDRAKREAFKCWLSKWTFSSLICSLFACLFVCPCWPAVCAFLLQCSRPARRWTSTATTANASAAPGCVTATTTARTTRTNRTAVSTLLLAARQQERHHRAWSVGVTHVSRCDAVVRGQRSHGQRPLTFALKSSWCSFDLWSCVHMCIYTRKKRPAVLKEESRCKKGQCLAGTLHSGVRYLQL